MGLITHALEKEKDNAAWEIWKQTYPWMVAGIIQFKPFKDFKEALISKQHSYTQISDEEIINEMMAVEAAHKRR